MREMTITVYKFDELSETTRQTVLNNLAYINVDYDWWKFIYDDVEQIGAKIIAFDIDRGNYCKIENFENWETIAKNIIENHGEQCKTYTDAKNYLIERARIEQEGKKNDFSEVYESEFEEANREFKNDLANSYLSMLRKEYEYMTSEEVIIETIKANEYEFYENGNLI